MPFIAPLSTVGQPTMRATPATGCSSSPASEQPQVEEVPDQAEPEAAPVDIAPVPPPVDDTSDLPPAAPDLDRAGGPKVVRKRNGVYPARTRPPGPDGPYPIEETSQRRKPSDDHFLTDLPDDLFNWPERRREE